MITSTRSTTNIYIYILGVKMNSRDHIERQPILVLEHLRLASCLRASANPIRSTNHPQIQNQGRSKCNYFVHFVKPKIRFQPMCAGICAGGKCLTERQCCGRGGWRSKLLRLPPVHASRGALHPVCAVPSSPPSPPKPSKTRPVG